MSLEFNKIAAAVLTGSVIAMASGFVADLLIHEEHLEESVYQVAGVESSEAMVASTGPSLDPVLPLLASASVEEGEGVAKKCAACHDFTKGGPNKVGPNLWGVVNRPVAAHEGFSFSDGLSGVADEAWSYSALNHFLADPKGYAPGTKMSFAGIKKVEDRAALIAYLRSLDDAPAPLPSEDEINALMQEAAASSESAPEGGEVAAAAAEGAMEASGGSISALLASADAEAGSKVARKCSACHSFEEGGPNKVGPNLYDLVGREIASHEGYSYSDALSSKAGSQWDYESLAAFLTDPKAWAPGTKMSFAGVKKPEELADLIAYLRSLSANPAPLPDKAEAEPVGAAGQQKLSDDLTDEEKRQEAIAFAEQMKQLEDDLARTLEIEELLKKEEVRWQSQVMTRDPDRGEQVAQDCAACHSWEENGADLIGPNLFGLFGRRVASRKTYDYSLCIKRLNDPRRQWRFWSYQLFLDFLGDPGQYLSDCGREHPKVPGGEERLELASYFRLQAGDLYHIE
jgi:cytochrome c